MNCSTPGFPVHHQLPESTQTHVHWVSDAIQPSHPLSSPSPPAPNPSQHQGLFKWVSSSHQVAKVLEFQLQHQSFQWNTQDWSLLGWTGWISLQSKGLSRVVSNTTVQKHQFFGAQRRQWHPTPVLLPGKSHRWRSLVGYNPLGREELDTTEWLHFHFSLSCTGEGNGSPLQYSCLENPRDGEPGGLLSMGSHRVGHDWSDLAVAAFFIV